MEKMVYSNGKLYSANKIRKVSDIVEYQPETSHFFIVNGQHTKTQKI